VPADKGWSRRFDEPIPLPRGRQLVTLEGRARGARVAGCYGSLDPGRGVERPDDVRAHRRHAGVEPSPRSRVQSKAERAALGPAQASARSMTRSEKDFASRVIWFLATIFRGHHASFGRNLTRRGSQLVRRLYPTGGAMRSEDKEYRQRNHRPSYQHENPVEEHRYIITRICA
jgi:hypothetical protein